MGVSDLIKKLFFPKGIKCIVCKRELDTNSDFGLCEHCVLPINEPKCDHCGRGFFRLGFLDLPKTKKFKNINREIIKVLPVNYNLNVKKENSEHRICAECSKKANIFSKAVAPFSYLGSARKLILRLKFNNCLYLADYLTKFMVKEWEKTKIDIDFVTFVPMMKKRIRQRGYNQSQKLAQAVAKQLNKKCMDILDRVIDVRMSKLSRIQRLKKIKGCFKVIDGVRLNGQSVLLIDDVLTTASTSNECSGELIKAGAGKVFVLAIASAKTFSKIN